MARLLCPQWVECGQTVFEWEAGLPTYHSWCDEVEKMAQAQLPSWFQPCGPRIHQNASLVSGFAGKPLAFCWHCQTNFTCYILALSLVLVASVVPGSEALRQFPAFPGRKPRARSARCSYSDNTMRSGRPASRSPDTLSHFWPMAASRWTPSLDRLNLISATDLSSQSASGLRKISGAHFNLYPEDSARVAG